MSNTNKNPAIRKSLSPGAARLTLETSLQFLKGVGPRYAAILQSKGINTLRDILLYLPRDYQDRSTVRAINELKIDETVLVRGHIINYRYIPIRTLKRPLLEATLQDKTGRLTLKWFHYQKGYFESQFKDHPQVLAYGQIRAYGSRLEILHPELEYLNEEDNTQGTQGILPIYPEPEGLTQRLIRKIIHQALETAAQDLPDDLPMTVLKAKKLLPIKIALHKIHSPKPDTDSQTYLDKLRNYKTEEQRRLIFDDLFKFEWVVGRRRINMRREQTDAFPTAPGENLLSLLRKRVPFEFTDDQNTAIHKIYEDLNHNKPMNRLLQGDVGCGKTLVALASALPVVAAGGQVAIMAPTEILAEQHLVNATRYLQGLELPSGQKLQVGLLAGSSTKSHRDQILRELAAGTLHVLLGTHALIEPVVVLKSLGLVIIDEQHRFGVDQRMKLKSKGRNPHMLNLTATPIPRTLALTAYGDLDVTTIKQLPKGRPEITTRIVKGPDKERLYDAVKEQLKKGRQAYIIYPLVEESEKIDLANAVHGAEELANGPLYGFKVGLLHGKMKPQEKAAAMDQFKAGHVQALVSTTVVEVGVDVPNATVLIIEHAERFGLSQLHQLRGRIGRGTEESFCFLCIAGGKTSDIAYERLKAMEETRDGFKLAELDLKMRGPGEFLGTRQSGELNFPCADIVRDQDILHEARQAAFEILKSDPDLTSPENLPLRNFMLQRGSLQQARFETA